MSERLTPLHTWLRLPRDWFSDPRLITACELEGATGAVAYLTLCQPPQATQWALDLAWRVGATEYDAELVPLSEQVNCDTLRAEIVRRLPEAADYDLADDDLEAALESEGAVDHDDTATRYLGSLRVSEAAQPEREALRQQVAKFSA
jgi:hypothetical protein